MFHECHADEAAALVPRQVVVARHVAALAAGLAAVADHQDAAVGEVDGQGLHVHVREHDLLDLQVVGSLAPQLIARRVHKRLRPVAMEFYGVEGSALYDRYATGKIAYLRFVLRSP